MTDSICQSTVLTPENLRHPSESVTPDSDAYMSVLDAPILNPKVEFALVNTVKENETFFTPAEIIRAKRARNMLIMMGSPSERDFIAILNHKLIPNVTVTHADYKIAKFLFGKDLGSIRGKTTRQEPPRLVNDYIAVPKEIL